MSAETIATLALFVSVLSLVVSGYVALLDRPRIIARSNFFPGSGVDEASVHVLIVNAGRRAIVLRLFGGSDKDGVTSATFMGTDTTKGLPLEEHGRWEKWLSSYEDIDSMSPDGDEIIEYAKLWFEDTLGRRYNVRDSAANIKKLRDHLKEQRRRARVPVATEDDMTDKMQSEKNAQLVGEETLMMTGTVTARSHANLALHHLFAACRFAARVIQVEQSNVDQPFGDFWEEILQNALGVVTLTVASLEAHANEMYFEGTILGTTLSAEARAELAQLVDRADIFDKYRLALVIRANKRLDRGATPGRNADALIKLRNAVVHFRPEWFEEKGEHEKLSTKWLADKFEPSVFLPDERVFPRAWASGSCAVWALRTTVNFIDHFYAEAGLPSPLEPFRAQLSKLSENAL